MGISDIVSEMIPLAIAALFAYQFTIQRRLAIVETQLMGLVNVLDKLDGTVSKVAESLHVLEVSFAHRRAADLPPVNR